MPRRRPLSREQREKRAGKRAARAEAAPLREAMREARKFMRGGRAFSQSPLAQAEAAYGFAVASAQLDPPELVVCERCGLIQENHRGRFEESGLVTVSPCPGFEGIGCGSLHAETPESFDRHVQHVTI